MIKRFVVAAALLSLAAPSFAQAPMAGERGEAKATMAGKAVSIEYGRPSLKGRDMLAQAAVGQQWRMGSNAATSLKTEADLAFGAAKVPKGEYILGATKVAADQWQLNVLAKADRAKVVDVPLTSEVVKDSVETFTVELKGAGDKGEFRMVWGTTALKAAFTAK